MTIRPARRYHRWYPRDNHCTFPICFPCENAAGDDGWHIDVSYGYEHTDFMEWRANVRNKGRALLMLFLFSDVGPNDALYPRSGRMLTSPGNSCQPARLA